MSIIFFIIEAGLSRDTNEFPADQSKISAPNVSDTLDTDQFGLSVRSLAIGDETVPGKTSEAQRGGGGVPQGTSETVQTGCWGTSNIPPWHSFFFN